VKDRTTPRASRPFSFFRFVLTSTDIVLNFVYLFIPCYVRIDCRIQEMKSWCGEVVLIVLVTSFGEDSVFIIFSF
jgi:hypothetical protein